MDREISMGVGVSVRLGQPRSYLMGGLRPPIPLARLLAGIPCPAPLASLLRATWVGPAGCSNLLTFRRLVVREVAPVGHDHGQGDPVRDDAERDGAQSRSQGVGPGERREGMREAAEVSP